MAKTFTCPDCGTALPNKKAKCPYKTERKPRRTIYIVSDSSTGSAPFIYLLLLIFMVSMLIGYLI